MKQHEVERLAEKLASTFDLDFLGTLDPTSGGAIAVFQPRETPKNAGFRIVLNQNWKRLIIDFHPGTYARGLIDGMKSSSDTSKAQFSALVKAVTVEGSTLSFQINGVPQEPEKPESWPDVWNKIGLLLKTKPLDIGDGDVSADLAEIEKWLELFTACVLSLAPLETEEEEEYRKAPDTEGSMKRIMVNRYERDRVNRSICLHFHGTSCKVCNVSFGNEYGKIGEGFIHVHHLIPVSKISASYQFDPVKDLVPVCPNCHSMLHRREPPYTPEELADLISKARREPDLLRSKP